MYWSPVTDSTEQVLSLFVHKIQLYFVVLLLIIIILLNIEVYIWNIYKYFIVQNEVGNTDNDFCWCSK